MEKIIKDRLTDAIETQAAALYQVDSSQLKMLDGFESFIYEFKRDDGEYILRMAHSHRRSEELINGEVDFINYLAANGVGVSGAIQSKTGRLVEAISDGQGGEFLVTAFIKARGGINTNENWKPPLWQEYGRQMGRMNRLALDYEVSNPAWKRPHWDDPLNLEVRKWIPDQPVVIERFDTLMAHLNTLPRDKSVYGMIHQDAHGGNMFVDQNGQITFFDFDDCCYGWYTYDLAMVLFYAIPYTGDREQFTIAFMTEFLKGYREEFEINEFWLQQIPQFLKLREIDLYAILYRDKDSYDPDDAWINRYMNGRKEKIEQDVPFVDLDFRQFAG